MKRLKPGPELDALIATEIMCWHLSPSGKTWRDSTDQHRDRVRNWHPSTDIADAFRVIAFMQKRGFFPGMQLSDDGWDATMHADLGLTVLQKPMATFRDGRGGDLYFGSAMDNLGDAREASWRQRLRIRNQMTTLVERTPIPHRMRTLPLDPRGYPIPYIVFRDRNGDPHFTINDGRVRLRCLLQRRCGICGKKINGPVWFVGGPLSAFHPHGAYAEGPLHENCAEYALKVCPWLAVSCYMGRIDASTLYTREGEDRSGGQLFTDPTQIPDRPLCFVAISTSSYKLSPHSGASGPNVIPGRPFVDARYWRNGAQLSEAEGEALAMEALTSAGVTGVELHLLVNRTSNRTDRRVS